jgi:hypothetical protein
LQKKEEEHEKNKLLEFGLKSVHAPRKVRGELSIGCGFGYVSSRTLRDPPLADKSSFGFVFPRDLMRRIQIRINDNELR